MFTCGGGRIKNHPPCFPTTASTALGWAVQVLAIRLGVATGRDLASAAAAFYPRPARLLLWAAAEAAIVGADVQEVVGSAIALHQLTRLPLWAGVVVGATSSFGLLFVGAAGSRRLEATFGSAIAVMAAAFGVLALDSGAAAADVARGLFVPTIPAGQLATAVALVGAAVMPHNLFLHSYLVRPDAGRAPGDVPASAGAAAVGAAAALRASAPRAVAIAFFSLEAAVALAAAFAINVAVVTVFASGRATAGGGGGGHRPPLPPLPPSVGLADAGAYLAARFGPAFRTVWCVGLLASGQSATMVGALSGQILVFGLFRVRAPTWARVAATRALAVGPTLALALSPASGAAALDGLAQGLNVLQAAMLPLALLPLLRLTSSRAVMGPFANSRPVVVGAAAATLALLACNAGAAAQAATAAEAAGGAVRAVAAAGGLLYVAVVAYLAVGPAEAEGAGAADDRGEGEGEEGLGLVAE